MSTALVTLPDGKKARVTFDSQEQLDATVSDLVSEHKAPGKPDFEAAREAGNPIRRLENRVTEAIGEPALAAGSAAAGAAVGGARGVFDLITGQGTDKAVRDIRSTEEAMSYRPRTATGQAVAGAVQAPFTWLAGKADVAGAATSRGVKRGAEAIGIPESVATPLGAGAGAAVNTAIQSAPAVVGRVAGRVSAGDATLAARGAAVGEVSRGTAPGTPSGAGPRVGQQGGPGATQPQPVPTPEPPPGMTAAGAPRQPPSTVGAGPLPPNEVRAQEYARSIGLDWSQLGLGTRKALASIAQDAGALERLSPAHVKRQAILQQLPIPVRASRGQITQDPVQLRREALAATTPEGQPIKDIDVGANRDIQANLEVLRGRVGGRRGGMHEATAEEIERQGPSIRAPTKTPTQVGESAQEAPRAKAKWSKKGYQALFKIARETEPTAEAGLAPVQEVLKSNPEIQHLGWVSGWLNKARSVKQLEEGAPLEKVTLNELHDLRSKATDISRTGGKEGHYAGLVVKAVDEAMKDVPEGAKNWRRAMDAFRKHQEEFSDQGIIKNLVSQKKGGADRKLALEKTWKTIATGPLEQLRQVKKTLLTGGTPELRMKGRSAWRDIRAETVNRILEDARNVSTTNPDDLPVMTAIALKRSINRIPRENLKELVGVRNVRMLDKILRAREITRGRTTESGTVPNMLVMVEKLLGHIPGGGKYAAGALKGAQKLGKMGESARIAREAEVSPIEQTAREVERAQRSRIRRALRSTLGGPTLQPGAPPPSPPPTIGNVLNP